MLRGFTYERYVRTYRVSIFHSLVYIIRRFYIHSLLEFWDTNITSRATKNATKLEFYAANLAMCTIHHQPRHV